MELHREPRLQSMNDAFVGTVVSVYHKRHPVLLQRVLINCIAVILRCDIAARSSQIHDWLVHTSIAKLHLVGLGSRSQSKNLVSQANAENGCPWPLLHYSLDVIDGFLAFGRIARAVAEEKPIKFKLREVVVPRHHSQLHLQVVYHVPDDVVLHAAVNSNDVHGICLVSWHEDLLRLSRDFVGEVPLIWIVHWQLCRGKAPLNNDLAQQGSRLPDELGDRTCIHSVDARHSLRIQPLAECPD
mmetsp:Transcript_74305/g.131396  ORF Transcript_74305/g.131396 Transcript_74305/m.131396 type:complete len:242 (-) Transcript_74305:463-1188(-)